MCPRLCPSQAQGCCLEHSELSQCPAASGERGQPTGILAKEPVSLPSRLDIPTPPGPCPALRSASLLRPTSPPVTGTPCREQPLSIAGRRPQTRREQTESNPSQREKGPGGQPLPRIGNNRPARGFQVQTMAQADRTPRGPRWTGGEGDMAQRLWGQEHRY